MSSALHAAGVTISWDSNPESDIAGYNVYKRTLPSSDYGSPIFSGLSSSTIIADLPAGNTYGFIVTAYDQSGNESQPSQEKQITINAVLSSTAPSTTTTISTFPPPLISPAPGSTLTSSSVTFTGTHTSQDLEHSLRVGTTNGGSQIFSKSLGSAHSVTVANLPNTGTVYGWYWTRNSSGWFVTQATYSMNVGGRTTTTSTDGSSSIGGSTATGGTTSTSTTTTNAFPPPLVSPAPSAILTSSTVTFSGAHTSQDLEHAIRIGTTNGGAQIFSKSLSTTHSMTVTGLPATGTIYVWYWTRNSSGWFVNRYTYTMNTGGK